MKKIIRAKLLRKRDSIPPDLKVQKEAAIEKKLFSIDVFQNARNILMYASFRSEVNTMKYLNDVIRSGKKLVLPMVDSRHKVLRLYEVRDTSELVPGYMGIPEPAVRKKRAVTLKNIDLVVIPGAGFDPKGNRLGYGAGYYDKLLSGLRPKTSKPFLIALAFEEQIEEEIPAEPHDIRVDIIITDKRLIYC